MPHKNHSVTIYTDGMGAAVHVPDILSSSLDNNVTVDPHVPSYEKYPTHLSTTNISQQGQFESFAVEALMDALGLPGICITSATNTGVKINLAKTDTCGDPSSSSVHRTLQIKNGLIYPMRLTCEHGGDARLQVGILPRYDGTNLPVIPADSAALPTITIATKRWTLGTIKIGNVVLADFTRVEIDFANKVELRATESALYGKHIEQKEITPTVMVTGIDPTLFATSSTIPLAGVACTHANTILFFRKRSADGAGFVADGTAEHLKFTAHGIAHMTQLVSGQDTRFVEDAVRVTTRKDDSGNAPLAYTGATAIS